MEDQTLEGVKGWLLVYLIGSVPLLMMHSMGLSGWFFEYPAVLMVAIFLALGYPLLLILLKSPKAPRWNIAVLWIIVALMTLRSISILFVEPMVVEGQSPMSTEELLAVGGTLAVIVGIAAAWAIIWTKYFKQSVRVRSTFSLTPIEK